jgi:hypothetical protein
MEAEFGMLVVETIAKIRRAYFVDGRPIEAICRELGVARKVVRKVIRSQSTEFRYERETQPQPKMGPWSAELDRLLVANESNPRSHRLRNPGHLRRCERYQQSSPINPFWTPIEGPVPTPIDTVLPRLRVAGTVIWYRTSMSDPRQPHDVTGRDRRTEIRPCLHEFSSALQCIGAPVGLLRLVANDVRKRLFRKLAREGGFVSAPVTERAAEAVHRAPPDFHAPQHGRHRHVGKLPTAWGRKYQLSRSMLIEGLQNGHGGVAQGNTVLPASLHAGSG